MAWIKVISPEAATGPLKRLYDAALTRAGRVFHVIEVQGIQPRILQTSTRLYMEVMHAAESSLSRAQREMIATAVSRENECFY